MTSGPEPARPSLADDYLERLSVQRRRRRLGVAVILAVAVALAVAGIVVLHAASRGPAEGADAAEAVPEGPYVFGHPDDPAALATIDHAKVHGELFPGWIVAAAHARSYEAWQEAKRVFSGLREAAAPDANLAAILDELQTLVDENAWSHASRILVLYEAWSDYLARNGVGYEVRAVVHEGGSAPPWVGARFYATVAPLGVRVGEHEVEVRLVRRTDDLNVRELYLGSASEKGKGVRVVVDRVSDFALRELWPLLAPVPAAGEDPLTPLERNLAPRVAADIEAALPADAVAVLRDTAGARACLTRVVRQVEERQECGSRYGFNFIPWNGFSADTLASAARRAERSAGDACPALTREEAADMARCSAEPAAAAGVRPALERLVAWAARHTVVHEARHGADDAAAEAGRPLACGDDTGLSGDSCQELSAYLAAFADPATGFTAAFQACSYRNDTLGGPAARALDVAFARLLPGGCESPLPPGFKDAAARLQRELLGRAEPVVLPAAYPATLPVLR
ncbi:MAG: hypothetical protein HY907_05195 [Deltaproteobacteria bacterium]|nr:hypothetical protein [Deltaproteobacteria bacterium]